MKTRSSDSKNAGGGNEERVTHNPGIAKAKQSIAKSMPKRKSLGSVGLGLRGKISKRAQRKEPNPTRIGSPDTKIESQEDPKWRTLLHNGVSFPPNYKPHGIPLKYDGKTVKLGPWAEEVASMFVLVDMKHYINEPRFCQNFFEGFRRALKKERSPSVKVVKEFGLCDFSLIRTYVSKSGLRYEKGSRQLRSLRKRCEYAIVDGLQQYVHGYEVARPAILVDREERSGMVRDRVFPEHVTINIGEESPDPDCPMDGHKWGRVIHEQKELWVASWIDTSYEDENYATLTGQRVRPMDGKPNPVSIFLEKINNL